MDLHGVGYGFYERGLALSCFEFGDGFWCRAKAGCGEPKIVIFVRYLKN